MLSDSLTGSCEGTKNSAVNFGYLRYLRLSMNLIAFRPVSADCIFWILSASTYSIAGLTRNLACKLALILLSQASL